MLTLVEARKRASIWLGLMAQGIDPLRTKKDHQKDNALAKERAELTMRIAMRRLIEQTSRKAATGHHRRPRNRLDVDGRPQPTVVHPYP